MKHCYFFEARSIQSYIMDGGRLSDMTQASERVDALCGGLLDAVAGQLELDDRDFMRRTSGAFVYLSEDENKIKRFRDAWSLIVPGFAPGLEFVHCLASGAKLKDAVETGFKSLAQARNQPSAGLPEAGPFAERCQRTGLAAVARLKKRGKFELVDAPIAGKRQAIKAGCDAGYSNLGSKFLPDGQRMIDGMPYCFPRNLEPDPDETSQESFPFDGDCRDIAIIHADGNGMGIILRDLKDKLQTLGPQEYLEKYRQFSEAVGKATLAAAREATQQVLLPRYTPITRKNGRTVHVLPARPLVLGGDDLSIIVRADLALAYAQSFVEAFEKETLKKLLALELFEENFAGLTACAGILFIKSNQPFSQAYGLAEALCQHAKNESAKVKGNASIKPSSLTFYRQTSSYFENYAQDILARVESVEAGGNRYQLTYGVYGIGTGKQSLPSLDGLFDLCRLLDSPQMSGGAARNLMLALHQAPALGRKQYARWREVMRKGHPALLAAFDAHLEALKVHNPTESHFRQLAQNHFATPLGDAVSLLAVNGCPASSNPGAQA